MGKGRGLALLGVLAVLGLLGILVILGFQLKKTNKK